jgi:hypothetical protein
MKFEMALDEIEFRCCDSWKDHYPPPGKFTPAAAIPPFKVIFDAWWDWIS